MLHAATPGSRMGQRSGQHDNEDIVAASTSCRAGPAKAPATKRRASSGFCRTQRCRAVLACFADCTPCTMCNPARQGPPPVPLPPLTRSSKRPWLCCESARPEVVARECEESLESNTESSVNLCRPFGGMRFLAGTPAMGKRQQERMNRLLCRRCDMKFSSMQLVLLSFASSCRCPTGTHCAIRIGSFKPDAYGFVSMFIGGAHNIRPLFAKTPPCLSSQPSALPTCACLSLTGSSSRRHTANMQRESTSSSACYQSVCWRVGHMDWGGHLRECRAGTALAWLPAPCRGTTQTHGASAHPQALEKRTPAGRLLSAPVLAMLLGMTTAAGGLLPTTCAAYDTVFDVFVPLACALCLLEADVSRWATRGRPVT